MGCVCDGKINIVTNSLKQMYKWRSTTWWHSLQTRMMEEDPGYRTRWKHKWRWHNKGNEYKIATRWATKENWMEARKKKNTMEAEYKFVTFVLNKMKLPTEHRKCENKNMEEDIKDKTPRYLGPEDITVHTRSEGSTVQQRGDSNVACKWINGVFSFATKYKEKIGQIQKTLHSWWKKESRQADLEH